MSTRINTAGERVRLGAQRTLRKEIKWIPPTCWRGCGNCSTLLSLTGNFDWQPEGAYYLPYYIRLYVSAAPQPSAPLLTCVFTQAVALAKFLEPAEIDVSATFNAPACISACLKLLQIKWPASPPLLGQQLVIS